MRQAMGRQRSVPDLRSLIQIPNLLLSESVNDPAGIAQAILQCRAETGEKILRRNTDPEIWRHVVLHDYTGACGER